ncbi:MAG: alpha/beta hydrolase [Acidobacteria bacterium]|nr:MAG: alpha/beta hydrolase [Acidobacteriota bacterium]
MKQLLMALLVSAVSSVAAAQDSPLAWAARLENSYRIVPNVTYLTASNWDAKLDLYVTRTPDKPLPTLIFIHGGGWTGGTKEGRDLAILPYLDMGMNVVNVEYRLARVAQAPAAVEDCRCALRWVIQHAKEYGIDVNRLVVSGGSAGGHLALTTGMVPASAGLDRRVSPLTYVRAGLPPVLTIHGDADPTVPYTQSVRLHKALTDAGVANELMTIPGGKHGFDCCTLAQRTSAYAKIREFLTRQRVLDAQKPPSTAQDRQ